MDPVIVINPYEVPEGREDEALAQWERFAEFFRSQPGFVSTKLHRAILPGARFSIVNVAEWKSAQDFQAALASPELERISQSGPQPFPHYPALYRVVRT